MNPTVHWQRSKKASIAYRVATKHISGNERIAIPNFRICVFDYENVADAPSFEVANYSDCLT